MDLRPELPDGTFGNGEKADEFSFRGPFETFRYVRRNGHDRTSHLVAQGEVLRKVSGPRRRIDGFGQGHGILPCLYVFKLPKRRHLETWNLKLGTWNLELGTWNLEPGTWNLEPETWNLEPETWNLEPETWNLEPET